MHVQIVLELGQALWVEVVVSENTTNEPLEHCGRCAMQLTQSRGFLFFLFKTSMYDF